MRPVHARRRFVPGRCIGKPPQGKPVLGQRGIGAVVLRFASTPPELSAPSSEQVPAVLRRESGDDLGGHRHGRLDSAGDQGQLQTLQSRPMRKTRELKPVDAS